MAAKLTLTIDGKEHKVDAGRTILNVCRELRVDLPVLCEFEGLSTVGACRLCLVEIEGNPKLLPACTTPVQDGIKIKTRTDKLEKYRRMIVELFFSERNHVCAVCVANNRCDLQKLGYRVGMTHVRFAYLHPQCSVDASHADYVMDHNRCILCTRCVRACDEIEGAHTWDVMGRGTGCSIISDFKEPWGDSQTCTSCGKCVQVCPTGALWPREAVEGSLEKHPERISELVEKRRLKS